MLKQFFEYAKQLLALTRDVQTNKLQIEELHRRIEELTENVRDLTFEVRRIGEHDAHEREKLTLRLENTLLRFERTIRLEGDGSPKPELLTE